MVQVIFNYDEKTRRWDPIVIGAANPTEARQAFNAVVLTLQELDPELLTEGLAKPVKDTEGTFRIYPAV